jgi:hypothetical protein
LRNYIQGLPLDPPDKWPAVCLLDIVLLPFCPIPAMEINIASPLEIFSPVLNTFF